MSNTIEQRVVEMRFDNSHFENNVSTTMSTLDKLKQKLNLSSATKGLSDIGTAAKNVDMSSLGNAVGTVSAKFSALQVMGVTALANITNSAVNAGKNIVKSLTIDPVKTGFSEYELKMGSIQTIMAGTGESLDTVNRYLNELNKYSDDTIYSFKDMTANIGKFTNAGVKLEDAVLAIKGISNEAAISGANANEASRAMYNFSQALSSGFVKLIDWKSIELANMATKDFKEQLIKTAVEVGTLKEGADGMYDVAKVVSKANAVTLNATKNFNDSLGNQWMTTEVLIETLRKYADETTEIGAKATAAATEVKTFSMMMDTLREAAQSGWAQTWELLVGDFEEAKEFFTELSGIFGDIIGDSADRRNNLFSGALTSNWDKLITKIGEAGIGADQFKESIRKVVGDERLDALIEKFGSLDKAVQAGSISSKDLKKALGNIFGTDNNGKLKSFVDGIKEIESTLRRGNIGDDVKKLQTALNELGYDLGAPGVDGIIGPITQKAIEAFQEANGLIADGVVGPDTLAALEKAGEKVEDITGDVDGLVESCDSLIDVITMPSGRELLLDSLMNVIKAIQRPLSAVGEALRNTFNITPNKLYKALQGLNKFTKKLTPKGVLDVKTWGKLTDEVHKLGLTTTEFELKMKEVLQSHGVDVDELIEKYGSLGKAFEGGAISFDYIKEALLGFEGISESLIEGGETVDKIRRTFEGLFAIVDIVATVLAGPLKLAFKVVTDILGRLGLTVLDVTAGIGDAIVRFRDGIDKIIGAISTVIVDNVGEWIKAFKETEFFKTIAGWFEKASKTISDAFDSITQRIKEFNMSGLMNRLKAIGKFFKDLATAIGNSKVVTSILDGIRSAFGKIKDFFGKFKLPEFNIDNLKTFSSDIVKIGEKIVPSGDKGILGNIVDSIAGFGKHLRDNVVNWNWTVFKETALEKFATFWIKSGDLIKKGFEKIKEVFQAIVKFILGTEELNLPAIIDLATKFLGLVTLIKVIDLLDNITVPFDNITNALDNLASSLKWDAIAGAFKSMALALGVFTVCILVLTQLPDMKKAWHAVGMMIALMAVMGSMVTLMGWVAGKAQNGLNTAGAALSLLMLVGALAIVVHTLKEIDKLELKNPGKTFLIIGAILLTLTAGVRMISAAGGSSFRSVAAILTLMAALKLILDVLDAYDKYDWSGKQKSIERMLSMLLALSVAIRIASGGTKAGASSSGLALTLIAMVISLKMLLGVIEDVAAMDNDVLVKGGAIVAGMLIFLTGMLAVVNLTGKSRTVLQKGERAMNNFAGLALALLAVVAAIWLLGKMDYETLKQGGFAVGQILLLFTGMLAAIGATCSGLKMGSIITMMIMIGVIMAETAIIVKMLDGLSLESKLGTVGALGGLLLVMAAALRIMSSAKLSLGELFNWTVALGVLTIILVALTNILTSMKDIEWSSALANAAALGLLLSVMTGVLYVVSKVNLNPMTALDLVPVVIGMIAVLAVLSQLLIAMDKIDAKNALGNAAALSLLMTVLTGVMAVCAALGSISTLSIGGMAGCILGIALLGAVILELGIVLNKLKGLGICGMLDDVKVLSALLIVLTGVMAACAALGLIASYSIGGMAGCILGIALLGGVVLELGIVLATLKKADMSGMENEVKVLSALLIVLTGVMAACTALGLISTLSIGGMAGCILGIALLGAVILELGLVLSELKKADMSGMEQEVKTLSTLLIVLTGVMAACTLIGFAAGAAIAGVAVLLVFVGALVELVTRIGELMSNPKLAEFLDTGIAALERLAHGIGSIVSNFGEGLTSKLPKIGENLSSFADSLGGFLTTMESVDSSVVDNAKTLAEAVMALTKGDFIKSLTNLFGRDDDSDSLASLGTSLSDFGGKVSGFIDAMSSIKPETATSMDSFINAIVSLNDLCRNNNISDGTLEKFGESVSGFAESMKTTSESLSTLTDEDVENIKRAAAAGEAVAELNACLPREGGLWQSIAGEQDLASWGKKINSFAESLLSYSAKVSGSNIDTTAIQNSVTAGKAIAELNEAIPTDDGIWQWLSGVKDMSAWGTRISSFASSLVSYSNKVSQSPIDVAAITNSVTAAKQIAELNNAIPAGDGVWQWLTGEKDLSTFGQGLGYVADGMLNYAQKAVEINAIGVEPITQSGVVLQELARLVKDYVPNIDKWFGDIDPIEFGNGLTAIASGMASYCSIAATIDQADIDAIDFSKQAVEKLKDVVESCPDVDSVALSTLNTAITRLQDSLNLLNTMSSAEYDFSGIPTLKKAIVDTLNMFSTDSGISPEGLLSTASNLSTAATSITTAATTLTGLNDKSYGGVAVLNKALEDLAKSKVDDVITKFSGKAESLQKSVSSVVSALENSLGNSTGVTTAAGGLAKSAADEIKSKKSDFKSAGKALAESLQSGLKDKASGIKSAAKSLATGAVDAVKTKYNSMKSAGSYLVDGFAAGITARTWYAEAKAKAMANAAEKAAKAALDINSPSKVFRAIGYSVPEGFAMGIDKMTGLVVNSADNMANSAIDNVRKSISNIARVVESDIDTQPTIRPVLDLSDVRSGVSTLDSMLNLGSSVGVSTNIGAISSMMNRRSQNGVNDEVVSAINKLRKDLGNVGGTTYQINGVTYDDGSNISDAVKTIVRAARIERRV